MSYIKQHPALDLAALAWDIASVPYSVARADALDRIRESGPDVATMEDEGGGVHALYDPAMRSDIQNQPAMTILGLVTYADPSTTLGEIVDMAREISELGVHVCCKPHRNERGIIDGFTLGRLVA